MRINRFKWDKLRAEPPRHRAPSSASGTAPSRAYFAIVLFIQSTYRTRTAGKWLTAAAISLSVSADCHNLQWLCCCCAAADCWLDLFALSLRFRRTPRCLVAKAFYTSSPAIYRRICMYVCMFSLLDIWLLVVFVMLFALPPSIKCVRNWNSRFSKEIFRLARSARRCCVLVERTLHERGMPRIFNELRVRWGVGARARQVRVFN